MEIKLKELLQIKLFQEQTLSSSNNIIAEELKVTLTHRTTTNSTTINSTTTSITTNTINMDKLEVNSNNQEPLSITSNSSSNNNNNNNNSNLLLTAVPTLNQNLNSEEEISL